jgi:wyosine [tRNA(Phe)-imidazoG37] synthetase (radical SAM superfamily)
VKITTPQFLFGPVPSRRLGRSLGVDLAPFKTCTYDCIYCQIGRTTHLTVEYHTDPPPQQILSELRHTLKQTKPDYITLSGSGEPTLYAPLAELIHGIRALTAVPVAVLTNGSLLSNRDVQDAVRLADLVAPSLDAGDAATFRNVNRPHPGISFESMVEGLVEFRSRYAGPLWLEIFLLRGVTALASEAAKIATLAARIRPDKVQINTVTRPPAESFAYPVPREHMVRLARCFTGGAEVIADYQAPVVEAPARAKPEDVLALLGRRPCTLQDVAAGLRLHPTQAAKLIEHLTAEGRIVERREQGRLYFLEPRHPTSLWPPTLETL